MMPRHLLVLGLVMILLWGAGSSPAAAAERQPYRDPDLAALKSLVLPGWGQHGNGQSGKGYAFATTTAVGALLIVEVFQIFRSDFQRGLGWSLIGLSLGYGAVDAYTSARHLNRENGYDLASRRPSTPGMRVGLRIGFAFSL